MHVSALVEIRVECSLPVLNIECRCDAGRDVSHPQLHARVLWAKICNEVEVYQLATIHAIHVSMVCMHTNEVLGLHH